jgi:hypothetical protein
MLPSRPRVLAITLAFGHHEDRTPTRGYRPSTGADGASSAGSAVPPLTRGGWKHGIIPHWMNDPQPKGHMASYIGRAPRGARSRREAANQPMRGLVTAISYAVGTIGMLLWGAPPTDSTSVAGTSAWRVPSPRSAAGAILRIELRSSRHFRFEGRRRWAASEKVWSRGDL